MLGVLAVVMLMSLSSCTQDDIVVPISIEESSDDESFDNIITRAGGTDCGIQIIGTPPFSSAEPVHGLPGVTSYKFFVGNPPTGTTGVTIIFTAPDESNYPHSMTQNSSGNWYKEMTLSQSGHYTVVYRIYQGSSYTTVTPTPSYVDNTIVNMSGTTKKLVWPFGADGSSWTNKNPSSGGGAWYISCGPGQGTHTGTESQAQDWVRNNCQGATIKSPLDGIVFKKEQYNGGNIIGIRQTVGTTEYKLSINHLDSYAVGIGVGSYVRAGQTVIGYVGQTGNATGPHAHIHIKMNSNSVPFDFSAQ
jgi:hypothetical protein